MCSDVAVWRLLMGCRRMLGAHAAPDQRTACARRRVAHCPPWIVPPDAHSVIRHEAINTWIDAHPKKTLIEHGICLPSRRWMRKKPPASGRKTPIVGMRLIDRSDLTSLIGKSRQLGRRPDHRPRRSQRMRRLWLSAPPAT